MLVPKDRQLYRLVTVVRCRLKKASPDSTRILPERRRSLYSIERDEGHRNTDECDQYAAGIEQDACVT